MKKKQKPEPYLAAHVEPTGYLVLRDGVPCQLVNVSGQRKGGVLMPVPDKPIITFLKHRDATRAVARTERVRANIRASLVSEWMREQMPSFLAGTKFEIQPIGRQQ